MQKHSSASFLACVIGSLALLSPTATAGQSIITAAGGGTDDGRLPTAVALSPVGAALDGAGNLYIVDDLGNRIRILSVATGVVGTVAGNGSEGFAGDGVPATGAGMGPSAAVLDGAGNLYLADAANNRIRRVAAGTGIISTIVGTGTAGFSGDGGPATNCELNAPGGLAIDGAGNLYIADTGNNRVRMVAGGVIRTIAGNSVRGFSGDGGPGTLASLAGPVGVAIDGAGNLFIADTANSRVRRLAAGGATITTAAGNGNAGFSGDAGQATQAALNQPLGVAVDAGGNLAIADTLNNRVRRVAGGVITTLAGTGAAAFSGDGGPAASAGVTRPAFVLFDGGANLYVADAGNYRIRKIAAGTTVIATVAGNGVPNFTGDGGPATSGGLGGPTSVAVSPSGDLFIADRDGNRIRRVAKATGLISTYAGGGIPGFSGDGGPATAALLNQPTSIAIDKFGNLYIADTANRRIRQVDASSLAISTVAGNGSASFAADGLPATQTPFPQPMVIATDDAGTLYVADHTAARIRTFRTNGTVRTVVGTGTNGFSGDNGPASAAMINKPGGIAFDAQRNIYIADTLNNRLRKVTALTGVITTIAGGLAKGFGGDGQPASTAIFNNPASVTLDGGGSIFISDQQNQRVRMIKSTSVISTIAGNGASSFTGDNGPATAASLNWPSGLAVDTDGTVYIADLNNVRVRALSACRTVTAPGLSSPADGAVDVPTATTLSWNAVPGAFSYDLFFSTSGSSSSAAVASDITGTSFSVSNLLPTARYTWKVVAKGDPFCAPLSTATSVTRVFTTVTACASPKAFALLQPADGTEPPGVPVLTWRAAAGASTYDVFLGTSNPPGPLASGLAVTTFTPTSLAPRTKYFWYVVAHAQCDASRTTASRIFTFTVQGICNPASSFALAAPANGASGVGTSSVFSWGASVNSGGYDLYLGTGSGDPPLYLSNVNTTSIAVAGLSPSTSYRWRVVAKGCDAGASFQTPVSSFTTAGCAPPGAPAFSFVPAGSVGVGQTYVVSWSEASGLDALGVYVVERSLSSSFATLLDSQSTTATSASFVSQSVGTVYHRVRAVAGCDASKTGPFSDARPVTIASGKPNVVFTVQPKAVITALGERLEDLRSTFTLENTGKTAVALKLAQLFLGGSPPFFTISDPSGGDINNFSLQPGQPRTFQVRFSGPSSTEESSYEGVIVVLQANFQPLPIAPFGYVSLKVGGGVTAVPEFRVAGAASEYTFFPGLAGDDSDRPAIPVDVHNPGDTPMEVGAEIGPELWLVTAPGWNSTPIPPHASRTVLLKTARNLAPNGSALPRYTYFTVRTKAGQTARLLVQDNDASSLSSGRGALPDRSVRSYIIPSVVHASSRIGNTFVSKMRLSNVGSDAVQADLYFTPAGVEGFDQDQVRSASVLVPPNDVVTLTDPLIQLFGLGPGIAGQLEVRAATEKIGLLNVTSGVDAAAATGGTFGFQMPTALRGEGARLGYGHFLTGVTQTADLRTNLILAETTGIDHVAVRAVLYDKNGTRKGDTLIDVPRYGQKQISGIVPALGGGDTLEAGRIELEVESGGGSAVAVITVIDNTNDDAVTYASKPLGPGSIPTARPLALHAGGVVPYAATTASIVVPAVVNGFPTFRARPDLPYTFRSLMGFASQSLTAATYQLEYRDLQSGLTIKRSVTVNPRQTIEYKNVLEELFNIPAGARSQGPIFVTATLNGTVYCKVYSNLPKGTLGDGFAVVPLSSDSVTGGGMSKPIYVDGLEQSVDDNRGTRSNLILNELSGAPTTVVVRLYEAGNRATPIAEQSFTMAPFEKKQLSTVFQGVGLDSDTRRKDRTNVMCQVTATSGAGLVSAVVTTIDNKTGDTRNALLSPTGGTSATGPSIGF